MQVEPVLEITYILRTSCFRGHSVDETEVQLVPFSTEYACFWFDCFLIPPLSPPPSAASITRFTQILLCCCLSEFDTETETQAGSKTE